MLSSVPITIGGENYSLQFTPQDVDDIETSQDHTPMALLIQKDRMACTGTVAAFLHYGLKVPGKFGQNGEPIRALPQGSPGHRGAALTLVYTHTSGKPMTSQSDLIIAIYRALAVGNWYNLAEMMKLIEASASVPQGDSTPKNSEGPGSNLSKK
jgi:hypothetical protein